MTNYDAELIGQFYDLIESGHKIVEGRLKTGKWKNMRPSEYITFSRKDENGNLQHNKKITVQIIQITQYATFRELLSQEGLKYVLPGTPTIDDGVDLYKTWYSPAMQLEHGVLAIQFEKFVSY